MNKILIFSIALLFTLTSCSKAKKYTRKIEGDWNITTLYTSSFHTGICGVSGIISELSIPDAGIITFSDEVKAGDESGDWHTGQISYDYSVVASAAGSYEVKQVVTFNYYIGKIPKAFDANGEPAQFDIS